MREKALLVQHSEPDGKERSVSGGVMPEETGAYLPGGKYEVLDSAGKGGAGEVFRVYDRRFQKSWAAKRVKKNCPGMEGIVLGKVDAGCFPRIVDRVEDGEFCYLIMDWIEGETLKTRIEREGALPVKEAVRIGIALCDAIGALHDMQPPLLYLDCKPSNIMLDREGKLWLIDFGSALEAEGEAAVPIAASPGFAAPELLGFSMEETAAAGLPRRKRTFQQESFRTGQRKADVRSDVYGLGRTLYAALSGMDPSVPPYGTARLRECNPTVPYSLVKIVEKCMKTDPAQRYGTMAAVRNALLSVQIKERQWGRHLACACGTWLLLGLLVQQAWLFFGKVTAAEAETKEKLLLLGGMALLATAAALWRRFAGEERSLGWRLEPEPLQSVLRTEKKAGRWLFALLVWGCLFRPAASVPEALATTVPESAIPIAASTASESLPLILRDAKMRRLLIKDGCALQSNAPVFLELDPQLFPPGEELRICVTAVSENGEVGEYSFLYMAVE